MVVISTAMLNFLHPAVARVVSALPTYVALDFRVFLALRISAHPDESGLLLASTYDFFFVIRWSLNMGLAMYKISGKCGA